MKYLMMMIDALASHVDVVLTVVTTHYSYRKPFSRQLLTRQGRDVYVAPIRMPEWTNRLFGVRRERKAEFQSW